MANLIPILQETVVKEDINVEDDDYNDVGGNSGDRWNSGDASGDGGPSSDGGSAEPTSQDSQFSEWNYENSNIDPALVSIQLYLLFLIYAF